MVEIIRRHIAYTLLRLFFRRRVERERLAGEAMRTMQSAWFYLWREYNQTGIAKETLTLFPEQLAALNIVNRADRTAFEIYLERGK
jgi:hypothetical protein